MNEEKQLYTSEERLTHTMFIAALLVLCIVFSAVPAYAWLYSGRSAVGIAKISNPTALFISAANMEDIQYLDLSGLDVTKGTAELDANDDPTGRKYQDFVFSIHGDHVGKYRLQLAYTTNNQFSYELYHATDVAPASYKSDVTYTTHPQSGTAVEQHYYVASSTAALSGAYLNRKSAELAYTGSETPGANQENLHHATYGGYDNVNKYAEPIYWQSVDVHTTLVNNEFCDYYVLRVYWSSTKTNDKETDIIYIAARNTTS